MSNTPRRDVASLTDLELADAVGAGGDRAEFEREQAFARERLAVARAARPNPAAGANLVNEIKPAVGDQNK